VIVGFGDKVAMDDTLGDALAALFTGEAPTQPPPQEPPGGPPTTQPPTGGGTITPELADALRDAQTAYAAAQAALAKNPPDWAAFGQAQDALREALDRAARLSQTGGGSTQTSTPTGTSSPAT
jgi:uncharacterized membrane protein (UPF0182 family)